MESEKLYGVGVGPGDTELLTLKAMRLLRQGKCVVFITPGNPTVYFTYIYIHKLVAARGCSAELVPGGPFFCAAAAKLGISLCERSQRLLIVSARSPVEDTLSIPGNKVFMKAGSSILQLRDAGLLKDASMVENCGMRNKKIYPHFGDVTENSGYFPLVLVREDV